MVVGVTVIVVEGEGGGVVVGRGGKGVGEGWLFTSVSASTCRHCIMNLINEGCAALGGAGGGEASVTILAVLGGESRR